MLKAYQIYHEKEVLSQDLALTVSACAIKELVLWRSVGTAPAHIKVIEVNSTSSW